MNASIIVITIETMTCTHLIRHADEYAEEEKKHVRIVRGGDLVAAPSQHLVRHDRERRHRNGEVVAVRLDEIVARDRRRIDVVLPERPQYTLATTRTWHWSSAHKESPKRRHINRVVNLMLQ